MKVKIVTIGRNSLQELENLYGSLSQRAFKGELAIREGGEDKLAMAAEQAMQYEKTRK